MAVKFFSKEKENSHLLELGGIRILPQKIWYPCNYLWRGERLGLIPAMSRIFDPFKFALIKIKN